MWYKKPGMPEIGELVLCTVKKILFHSVFAGLDEYKGKEGMIHISEVSPGRIRTLRDYVKEGKKIVCKVLRVDPKRQYIDLSLRRVGGALKVKKISDFRQEEKAEKLLESIGKETKKSLKDLYNQIGFKAIETHGSLNAFFQTIAIEGRGPIEHLGGDKVLADLLYKSIRKKIKAPQVKITGYLKLSHPSHNGIDVLKQLLQKQQKAGITINYVSAPKYKIEVTSSNYKDAEAELKQITDNLLSQIKEAGGEGKFLRQEK